MERVKKLIDKIKYSKLIYHIEEPEYLVIIQEKKSCEPYWEEIKIDVEPWLFVDWGPSLLDIERSDIIYYAKENTIIILV